ncbi:uncharacterized protein LOC105184306 isoform X2 [Harpegnathos saltator]|nr:uncharacterized protein LOC105184306 isoform X2 [Harpegnathos saltator]XP_025159214.1 uncharacterized protein LOC105184306 isoform X2 [Harpegnathos saltator]XP_025159215.1 uncharacterized protein LOC105184306 isoform X2 [Harpegnathos saltator]XP_025159216.1 uncharacterized protein LOC105184306 isoform X2 [Harpegnathos saltator]
MYYVVFWDEYCQVVPDSWVNFNAKTFTFPLSKKNITNTIKKKISPGNDWNISHFHKILGPYNTFDKAREAEKSCIDISTSDDIQFASLNEPIQTLPLKRLITKKKFYDDESNNYVNNCNISKKYKSNQHPPSNYKIHEGIGATSTNVELEKNSLHFRSVSSEYNVQKREEDKILSVKNNPSNCNVPSPLNEHQFSIQVFHEDEQDDEEMTDDTNSRDYDRNIDNKENEIIAMKALPITEMNVDEDIHVIISSLYEKVDTLHQDFQQFKTEIKHEAAKNNTKLKEIVAILRESFQRNEENEAITMDLMPEFPMTSVEEYVQFNETLKNDEAIRKCFEKKIKCIGGDSTQKMISNILTYCITFDVGHKLTWTGAKNTIAIENTTFANIIVSTVNRTKGNGPDCTIALIVKHVKNWLQHAGDKMRYRNKKVQQ